MIIIGKIIILLVNQIKISTNLLYQSVLKMVQTFFFWCMQHCSYFEKVTVKFTETLADQIYLTLASLLFCSLAFHYGLCPKKCSYPPEADTSSVLCFLIRVLCLSCCLWLKKKETYSSKKEKGKKKRKKKPLLASKMIFCIFVK